MCEVNASTLTLRAPRGEDLHTVYEVIVADDRNELGKPDIDESDVSEWWAMPHFDKSRDAWILEREGTAVGYGQTHDRNKTGRFDTDVWISDEEDEDGYGALLDAALQRARELLAETSADNSGELKRQACTWSVMGRERRAAWLEARGFSKVRRFYRMSITVIDADPPELPGWLTLTPLGSSDEDARRGYQAMMSTAFIGHWGHVPIDYDTWLARVTASPNLDWDTVWLARVDGEPAAGLKMRIYEDVAFIDTVGTLKEFRGRGIAGLLLRTAFAEALRRGQPYVELGVDTENDTGAVAVYEKAGMSVAFAHDEWSRAL
ncbi:MAG: mycothiol synthase [Frankiales bacterium]|nr:mycothiol synthase [Frankiales bacterium]